jgi:hypothetical protein
MLARIDGNAVAEFRDIEMSAIPEHKRALWRPVVYEGEGPNKETIIEAGQVRIVRSTPSLTQADYAQAVQAHIDAAAASKGYGDGYGLASYRDSTVPEWAAEAQAFIAWRDSVWLASYLLMGEVVQGLKAAPTIEELKADLPTIDWPK